MHRIRTRDIEYTELHLLRPDTERKTLFAHIDASLPDSEKLNWSISRDGRVIEVHVMSDVTGERVDTLRLQILEDSEWDIDEMSEVAEDIIEGFIEHHFGTGEQVEDRIESLESLFEDIRSNLLYIKLKEIE
ncbi:MAG: hypothetical protein ACFFEA_13885 [Candidatus Thorarchaeota archaeon]